MKHLKEFNLFEGRTFKDNKKPYAKKSYDPDKKEDFREKIEDMMKSKKIETKRVGNDLEIIVNDCVIIQVMFRNDYVGIKNKSTIKTSDKFTKEFKYNELGKIKEAISKIISDSKEEKCK